MTATPVDGRQLRTAFSRFATGVTVVTYEHEGQPRGLTLNSFTSVSLEPALALVSIAKRANAAQLLADRFAVNVLSERQQAHALQFSGRPQDELEVGWRHEHGFAPELCDVVASFQCRTWQVVPAGDHDLYVGEVVGVRLEEDARPLLFLNGRFTTANFDQLAAI